jgi:hypothetical protein
MAETGKKAKTAAAPRKPKATKATAGEKNGADPKANGAAAGPRIVSHDEIRALAHRYWAERGHPHGNPEDDWFRAEQELRGKAS